ncbi:MotA/TolQ/ExbB proton channel family protein [Myxacorys almedinensis]|uniref:MotA/TolQ/ExbB proton channel family protein n=1 Tax=Myxacorys almedinensis A TaxID=2690445 RepID=A0A8J7Z5B9_9CYAN|nr:MotA/TolQ/ExbB proton channel family protein [Myxacorys almedinensis]NDJ18451.1 MotA/TolQ/ExbB proton channel family protein [Myxacorys almedinensis A]
MLEALSRMPVSGLIIVIILFCFLVVATALIAERIRFWMTVSQRQPRFAKELVELYRQQPELVEEKIKRNIDLPISRIFSAALTLDHPSPEEFRLAMESELQAEIPTMKRFGGVLEIFVGLSPLLGLIGTITGLITAFGSLNIGDIGGTRTAGVSAGISEALITTAAGLIVAALCLLFASIFRNIYQRQMALIQEYGGQLELAYRKYYDRNPQPSSVIDQLSIAIHQLAAKGEPSGY